MPISTVVRNRLSRFLLGVWGIMAMVSVAAQALPIEIVGGNRAAIRVQLLSWQGSRQPLEVMLKDLSLSRLEVVLEQNAKATPPAADFSLSGHFSESASGLSLELELTEKARGLSYQFRQNLPANQLLGLSHQASDFVYRRVFNRPSLFAESVLVIKKIGARYQLVLSPYDLEGGQVIYQGVEPVLSARLSPDGRTVAYASLENGKAAVYVQQLASGQRYKLSQGGSHGLSSPVFSPDGQLLVASQHERRSSHLVQIHLTSGLSQNLSSPGLGIHTEPEFLPAGRGLLYVSDQSGSPQIYWLEPGSGKSQRLSLGSNYNMRPTSTSAGDGFYFIRRDSGRYNVSKFNLLTRETSVVTASSSEIESLALSPSGQALGYLKSQGRQKLWQLVSLEDEGKTRLLNADNVVGVSWGGR